MVRRGIARGTKASVRSMKQWIEDIRNRLTVRSELEPKIKRRSGRFYLASAQLEGRAFIRYGLGRAARLTMRQSRLKSLVWTGFLKFFPTGHLLDAPAAPSSPTSLPNFSTAAFLHRRTRATRLPQPKFMNSEEASKESMRLTVILFLPFHGSN